MKHSTKPVVTRILILIALSWSLFFAIAFLPGCAGTRTGCPSHRGMRGYAQAGFGKPLCIVKGCNYFSDWTGNGAEVFACYKHSIDDYQDKDSVIWLPYKKEMTFGY